MSGPSNPPDPACHAFRKDLADAALAGRVIASHYAEPVDRHLIAASPLHEAPSGDSPVIRQLEKGESFALLDSTLGWAWGYAGAERRVGYVESSRIGR